jgi:threonine/homoserine/homoserine lactone efflux protein
MRDGLGVLLVALGVTAVLLTRDKLWLVVAFAGVTLLAYGVLAPHRRRSGDGPEPPIF